jgi:hypothetical protein
LSVGFASGDNPVCAGIQIYTDLTPSIWFKEGIQMSRRITAVIVFFMLLIGASMAGADDNSSAHAQGTCWQPARLVVGQQGRVTLWPNLPNRLRSQPSFQSRVLGYIPAGGTFSVIGGPQCVYGTNFWQVTYNGLTGWTAEGNGSNTYWLEPTYNQPPPPPPGCSLPTRLVVGQLARVTPGLPNAVRTAPGTQRSGANSVVVGYIPGSGVFTVSGGPQCGPDGRWWWYVNYNGLIGWTAEGEGQTYWLEPWSNQQIQCPNFLPSRLVPGGYGAVNNVPYNPNPIYGNATYSGTILGNIPRGGVFSVLSGPVCGESTAWWQVNYNGLVGWTFEGNGSQYYLDPR